MKQSRQIMLGALAAIGIAAAAHAEEKRMTGAEISAALTGNSVDGTWSGSEYRSYFDPGGTTIYQRKGTPATQGRWSVKGDQYCSVWEPSGESCYDLARDRDTIIWIVPSTGTRNPSKLVQGMALY
jgi:hypothetical protein